VKAIVRITRFWRRRREARELARTDAATLIERYGEAAYEEARTRARDAQHAIPADPKREKHWHSVRRLIARQTGRERRLDTATRYLEK
jgi:hypothetical protein